MEKDPVCGMLVRPEEAAEQRAIQGKTYYFCSPGCVAKFDRAPQLYVSAGSDNTPGKPARGPG